MATEEWTEAKCLELIREFRERPILWDQKSPLFYKKSMKPDSWVEIGDAINVDPEKCRHKMVVLMSSFRREKAKYMNNLKYGSYPNISYQSTWFAFNEMSFLLDKEKERRRRLQAFIAAEDDSDTTADEEKTSTTTTEQQPVESIKWVVRTSLDYDEQDTRPKKLPKISVRDDQVLKSTPTSEEQPSPATAVSQPNEDEIKYFSNFIASKMMRYSEKTKNAVQQAICQVIFKADQHCYDQEPSETSAKPYEYSNQPSSSTEQQPNVSDIIIKQYYSDSD